MAKKKTANKTTKKKAASKTAAKKTTATKVKTPKKALGGSSRKLSQAAFSPNEIVQVVHDNDPEHTGCGGSVLSVDGNNLVQVKIFSEGKEILRSYMPSQLKRLL